MKTLLFTNVFKLLEFSRKQAEVTMAVEKAILVVKHHNDVGGGANYRLCDSDNLAFHRTTARCPIQISLLSSLPAPPWRSKTNPFIPNDAFRLLETVAAFIP